MTPDTLFESRYRIVRQLAEGGMGVVYEAEHTLTRRTVAIKCLHPEMTRNQEVVTRFQREATAAAAIGNEHIIDVLDMARRDDGSFYMVLEFLKGRDLATTLQEDGPFTVRRAVHVITQVCAALEAAHHKGVVHRDLKPENLFLVTRDGDPDYVKVLDFGISKFRDADGAAPAPLTRTGSMMGTPHYMSPEQIQSSRDVDRRADIFALGVIAHELLAGTRPFDADTIHLLIYRISALPPANLAEARPELPPALVRVVERMLAKAPDGRFQDCAEVRDALAPFARWEGDALATASHAPPPSIAFAPTGVSHPPPPPAARKAAGDSGSSSLAEVSSIPIVTVAPSTPRAASRSRWLVPALLAVGLGATGITWRLRATGIAAPAALPARAAPVAPAVMTPAPAAAAVPPSPSPVARTRVQLGTTPSDAEVLLDGRRIANPFDGELPASTELHRLEFRRSGYTAVVQDLSLEFRQVIRVRLRHGHGVDDRRRHPAAVTPSAVADPPPPAAEAPPAADRRASPREPELVLTPAPIAPPPPAAPGVAVPPPQQPLRHIEL